MPAFELEVDCSSIQSADELELVLLSHALCVGEGEGGLGPHKNAVRQVMTARGVSWSTLNVTMISVSQPGVASPASFRGSERATELLTRISVAGGCALAAGAGGLSVPLQPGRGAVQLHATFKRHLGPSVE